MSHWNDLSNKKSSSSILFDITSENSKIDKSLNDKEEKGAVFNLLGLTFHWACDCSSRSIDVQLWICHFVSCPHGLNMKNLFSVLFVIFNVLSYKQGICAMQCKDITTTSALTRLKDYLFCDYNREIRPTKHYNNATVINLGLNIQQFEVVSNISDAKIKRFPISLENFTIRIFVHISLNISYNCYNNSSYTLIFYKMYINYIIMDK